jgi:hypothetical protein
VLRRNVKNSGMYAASAGTGLLKVCGIIYADECRDGDCQKTRDITRQVRGYGIVKNLCISVAGTGAVRPKTRGKVYTAGVIKEQYHCEMQAMVQRLDCTRETLGRQWKQWGSREQWEVIVDLDLRVVDL